MGVGVQYPHVYPRVCFLFCFVCLFSAVFKLSESSTTTVMTRRFFTKNIFKTTKNIEHREYDIEKSMRKYIHLSMPDKLSNIYMMTYLKL